MTESIYKEFENKYYNPDDNDKRPGDNDNWKSIQKGFHDIGTTQLETSAGLTLGKGTKEETSVTAAELMSVLSSVKPIIVKGFGLTFTGDAGYIYGNIVGASLTGLKPNTIYHILSIVPNYLYRDSNPLLAISFASNTGEFTTDNNGGVDLSQNNIVSVSAYAKSQVSNVSGGASIYIMES